MPDNSPQQDERPARGQWHLERSVSLTHLFSTVAAISAMVVLGSKFDTRVTLLEQQVAAQHAVDARQDKDADDSKRQVREDYRAIDDKLQRLIERAKP